MEIRSAEVSEVRHLATLWYDGWQDAHANILPVELKRIRTPDSFYERLTDLLLAVRVAGPIDSPLGLCITKGDELYQLYVSADARGTGVAAALMSDADRTFAVRGIQTAWLACAIGNDRAARFYEKSGWHRAGTFVSKLDTPDGIFPLKVWRFEKTIRPDIKGLDRS